MLPVFPGAQGFGSHTIAGRYGQIIHVTNLNADGPGSLKEALQTTGPRHVIFDISGVITIKDNILISEPFLTVSGQTSPDEGITIFGAGLTISTHDVLIQHLHVRPGGDPDGPDFEVRDAIELRGSEDDSFEVYNVVVDHCSMSWGADETFSTWYPGVHDVTLSNSIVGESLDDVGHPKGKHSKGLLVGDHTRRISILSNLILHNDDRNPHVKGDATALIANNLVYNYGRWPLTVFDNKLDKSGPSLVSAIKNTFIAGPDSPPEHSTVLISRTMTDGTVIYLEDNKAKDTDPTDPCALATLEDNDSQCISSEPNVMVSPLQLLPVDEVEEHVLSHVGALPNTRDATDTRLVNDVQTRSGKIIDHHRDVGGAPVYSSTTRALSPPDNPHDDPDQNGYTNLEEWIHTFPKQIEHLNLYSHIYFEAK